MEKDFYVELLKKELVMAMGCTEPLALAYAGSLARHVLGKKAEQVNLECSNNIIKNVRCVAVPNSEEFNGIKASVLLGVFGGDYSKGFGCIMEISQEAKEEAKKCIKENKINVKNLRSSCKLHIKLQLIADEDKVLVEIKDSHLNVTKVARNDEVLYESSTEATNAETSMYEKYLSFEKIYDYSNKVSLDDVKEIIMPQIKYNYDIAVFGLTANEGVSIGQTILANTNSIDGKIKAYTASASEARMCGCVKPVIINSGSGNQGLSTSVPVIVYAKENNIDEERLIRALVFANLLTIKQKYKIGALSAFCGIVSSCCSAGAAITYLAGGTPCQIQQAISTHLATVPGIICDGAKASCASKIATALDSALLAFHLAMENKGYGNCEGILKESIDQTIDIVAEIGRDGMQETDEEIMKILLDEKEEAAL